MNWVSSTPTLMRLGPIALPEALRELLSQARVAAGGIEEMVGDRMELLDRLGRDALRRVWIESPLQVTVDEYEPGRAVVRVWASLVTGDPHDGPVEVLWRTHAVTVVWERDDWRIDAVAVGEGPTPVPVTAALPSPAADFAQVDQWWPAVQADRVDGLGE